MTPLRLDIQGYTNADYVESFPVTVDGLPCNLTGYTLDLQARPFPTSSTLTFTLATVTTDVQGIRVSGDAANTITIRINQATLSTAYNALVTSASTVVQLSYDLRITYPDTMVELLIQGVIYINAGVTHA